MAGVNETGHRLYFEHSAAGHSDFIRDATCGTGQQCCTARQVTPRTVSHVSPLREGSLLIFVFAEASFANNMDFSTQLGYTLFLCDRSTCTNCVHNTPYKSKPVVTHVSGGICMLCRTHATLLTSSGITSQPCSGFVSPWSFSRTRWRSSIY